MHTSKFVIECAGKVTTVSIEAERPNKATAVKPTETLPFDALRPEAIPAEELKAAGDGDPRKVPADLVAVLGDSRLMHWGNARAVGFGPSGTWLVSAGDFDLRIWDPRPAGLWDHLSSPATFAHLR